MARPKINQDEKKCESVTCNLTKSELEQLKLFAKKADLSYSNYVRKVIVAHIKNINMFLDHLDFNKGK